MTETSGALIGEFDRAHYQRAARTILAHPLITLGFPDPNALALVRRWATPLAEDMWEQFGYRLELTATTARLIRVHDELDGTRPAVTRTGREFDRRRYAYLALALAVLDRTGAQIAISELADRVAGEATRIDGLELSAERAADRAGFVDAVGWLEERGALTVADGSARRWADDPDTGEALYDVDREVIRAIYRPNRVLQHVDSVWDLLIHDTTAGNTVSRNAIRRQAGQRLRRALVERPVVYFDDIDSALHGMLRSPATTEALELLTGATAERRTDGALLLDVGHTFTDTRFPGPGTVAQAALLLLVAIADRIEDVDAPALATFPLPQPMSNTLAAELDEALPRSSVFRIDQGRADSDEPRTSSSSSSQSRSQSRSQPQPEDHAEPDGGAEDDEAVDDGDQESESAEPARRYPFLQDSWLRDTLGEVIRDYGKAFAARWLADPDSLRGEALELLARLDMVRHMAGGVLALPLLARYRNAVVDIRQRSRSAPDMELFEV